MTIRRQKDISYKKSRLLEEFRKQAADAQAQNEFRNERYKFKVILLDDDLVAAKEFAERLEHIKHCHVFVCQSEFSALKLLKQETIDLVIMDVELQNFNGFDFGASVKTLIRKNLPIIYFGKNNEQQVDHFLQNQDNTCFIGKGYEGNELQDKFLEMLDKIEYFNGLGGEKICN